MGYTAFEEMRKKNKKTWGIDSPKTPEAFERIRIWEKDESGRKKKEPTFQKTSQLEDRAIAFIRDSCEGLRFDRGDARRAALNDLDGKSLKPGQVPYHFEMDMDRRCLEVAIHRFLESGVAKDAFDVYFCYLEMFIGSYGKTKKMIEMLSEFETNASSLLMKHRDHYSHSVYVFLIGLAFYQTSGRFRTAYKNAYARLIEREGLDPKDKHDVAAHFLKFWGLTALFHDVGYPFELSFEQVKSYFGDTIEYVPFVTYNMNNFQNPKVGEIAPKAKRLKADCAIRYEELCRDRAKDSYESEKKYLEKMEKQTKALVKSVFGDDTAQYEEKYQPMLHLTNREGEENPTEPSLRYQAAIGCLEELITEIEQMRQAGMDKLKRLMPDAAADKETENLNAFLAGALYAEFGETYAFYDGADAGKKFDGFAGFAERSGNKCSYTYRDYLYDVLCLKPEHPEAFGGYIDHAYFSTITLLNTLIGVVDQNELNEMYTHALTAILLHNSLYKFSITNYKDNKDPQKGKESGFNDGKHFNLRRHPLAWLLMLCDELQCWDRTSYGQNSRGEVHPFDCELSFEGNRITATYLFDAQRYQDRDSGDLKPEYQGVKGTYKKLNAGTDGSSEFLKDIEAIISINGDSSFGETNGIELAVGREFRENTRYRNSYLSTSNFIHMYKFSILVHEMNHLEEGKLLDKKQMKRMEDAFEQMSLEYKINHISRAKKFSGILGEIGCFYSDKPMDCEIVTAFGEELNETMGPIEHERWCWEHYVMGWRYIPKQELEKALITAWKKGRLSLPEDEKERKEALKRELARLRECTKRHWDLFEVETLKNGKEHYDRQRGLDHFRELDEANGHAADSKRKDTISMCNLLKVLSQEDGVKVYRLRNF